MPTIYVFNSHPIEPFDAAEIRSAVTESNYHTLCAQYGLDPALIAPALRHLELQVSSDAAVPFFALRYQPVPRPPIVVTRWREADQIASLVQALGLRVTGFLPESKAPRREAVTVELASEQCHDLGLLFAYELARWAAVKGGGIVCGLDGAWYRLNAYKAFLPLEDKLL